MTVLTRLKAWVEPLQLDRQLAAGRDEHASPELERRAEVLRRARVRRGLADGLEHVVIEAESLPFEHGAAIPVQRDEVRTAEHDLLRLVRALRSAPPPPVRGIAEASLLLTDGAGPVFAPHPHG